MNKGFAKSLPNGVSAFFQDLDILGPKKNQALQDEIFTPLFCEFL